MSTWSPGGGVTEITAAVVAGMGGGGPNFTTIFIPNGVQAIGADAFSSFTNATSVTFGTSPQLTTIGDRAFKNCTSLRHITIPETVTTFGTDVFYNTVNLDISWNSTATSFTTSDIFNRCEIASVHIGPSVTTIPTGLFRTTTVSSVTFDASSSLTTVGNSAFRGCTRLSQITLPSSVTTIGDSAFRGSGLSSIATPSNLTSLGPYAFNGCASLTSASLSSSSTLTSIPDFAFEGCEFLSSVTLPNSITSLGEYAFGASGAILSVVVPASVVTAPNTVFEGSNVSLTLNGDLTTIPSSLFGAGAVSVTLGASVTSIPASLFQGSTGLTSITIPDSVTSIPASAFAGCTALTSVIFNATSELTTIGNYAFQDCTALRNFAMPPLVSDIGTNILDGCVNLTVTFLGVIRDVSSAILFANCQLVGAILSSAVTEILPHQFQNFTSLASVTFANTPTVTKIGDYAFNGCTALTGINIPDSVIEIGDSTFGNCLSMASIQFTMTSNLYILGNYAFGGCTSLRSLVLPPMKAPSGASTSIGTSPFIGCYDVALVYRYSVLLVKQVFTECLLSTVIIESNSEISQIPGSIFLNQTSLTSVTFTAPSYVATINGNAFKGCTALTSITLPNSVTYIGTNAFQGCSSLASVVTDASSGLVSIFAGAFSNCTALTAFTYPSLVTTVGTAPFSGCSSLASVTVNCASLSKAMFANYYPQSVYLGNAITSIPANLFKDVSGSSTLASVTFSSVSPLTSIGASAFQGATALTAFQIPTNVTTIGASAFQGTTSLSTVTFSSQPTISSLGLNAFNGSPFYTSTLANKPPRSLAKSSTSVGYDLTWQPPQDISANLFSGYDIFVNGILDVSGLTQTQYSMSFSELPAASNEVTVVCNNMLNGGADTVAASITITNTNIVPTITDVSLGNISATITWLPPNGSSVGVTGYKIYLNGSLVETQGLNLNTDSSVNDSNYCTLRMLTAGTSYTVEISALSNTGTESNKASTTFTAIPVYPSWWSANPVPVLQTLFNASTLTNGVAAADLSGATAQAWRLSNAYNSFGGSGSGTLAQYVSTVLSGPTIDISSNASAAAAAAVRSAPGVITGLVANPSTLAAFTAQNAGGTVAIRPNMRYITLCWMAYDMYLSATKAVSDQGAAYLIMFLPVARALSSILQFSQYGADAASTYIPANYFPTTTDGSIVFPSTPVNLYHTTPLIRIDAAAFGNMSQVTFNGSGPTYAVTDANIQLSQPAPWLININGPDILLPAAPVYNPASGTIAITLLTQYVPPNYFSASNATDVSFGQFTDTQILTICQNAFPANVRLQYGTDGPNGNFNYFMYSALDPNYVLSNSSPPRMMYATAISNQVVTVYGGIFYTNYDVAASVLFVPENVVPYSVTQNSAMNALTTLTFPATLSGIPSKLLIYAVYNFNLPVHSDVWDTTPTYTGTPRMYPMIPGGAPGGFPQFSVFNWNYSGLRYTQSTSTTTISNASSINAIVTPTSPVQGLVKILPYAGVTLPTWMTNTACFDPSGTSLVLPSNIASFRNTALPNNLNYYFGNIHWINRTTTNPPSVIAPTNRFNPDSGGVYTIMQTAQPMYAYMFNDVSNSMTTLNGVGSGSVGAYAVYGCSALTSLNLNIAGSIGVSAFQGCTGLTSLNLTLNTEVLINNFAFANCTGLTSLTITSSSRVILGANAFANCTGLTSITLTTVGGLSMDPTAFTGCSGVKTIVITNTGGTLNSLNFPLNPFTVLEDLSINSSGTVVTSGVTCAATLKSVKIAGFTVGLQANHFSGCSALQTVTIGSIVGTARVYSLENVFGGCSSLKNVSLTFIANSCPSITSTFSGLTTLETLTTSGGFLTLPNNILSNCPALRTVNLGNLISSVSSSSFATDSSLNTIQVVQATNPITAAVPAFASSLSNLGQLTSVSITGTGTVTSTNLLSGSVTRLQSLTLTGFSGALTASNFPVLRTLNITATTPQVITEYQFANNTVLNSVTYAPLTDICNGAFFGCTGLQTFGFQEGLESIGDFAFANTGLLQATIPSTVTSLGDGYFVGCPNLTSINYLCDVMWFNDPTRVSGDIWDHMMDNRPNQTFTIQGPSSIKMGIDPSLNITYTNLSNNQTTTLTNATMTKKLHIGNFSSRYTSIDESLGHLIPVYKELSSIQAMITDATAKASPFMFSTYDGLAPTTDENGNLNGWWSSTQGPTSPLSNAGRNLLTISSNMATLNSTYNGISETLNSFIADLGTVIYMLQYAGSNASTTYEPIDLGFNIVTSNTDVSGFNTSTQTFNRLSSYNISSLVSSIAAINTALYNIFGTNSAPGGESGAVNVFLANFESAKIYEGVDYRVASSNYLSLYNRNSYATLPQCPSYPMDLSSNAFTNAGVAFMSAYTHNSPTSLYATTTDISGSLTVPVTTPLPTSCSITLPSVGLGDILGISTQDISNGQLIVSWPSGSQFDMFDSTTIDISGSLTYSYDSNYGTQGANTVTLLKWLYTYLLTNSGRNAVNIRFNNSVTTIHYLDYKTGGTVDISSNLAMIYDNGMANLTNTTLNISADRLYLYNQAFNDMSSCTVNITISNVTGAAVYPGLDIFMGSNNVTVNSNKLLINQPIVDVVDMAGKTIADVSSIIFTTTGINSSDTINATFSTYVPSNMPSTATGYPLIKFQSTKTLQEHHIVGQPEDWFWCWRAPQSYYNPSGSFPGSSGSWSYYGNKPTLPAPHIGASIGIQGTAALPAVMHYIWPDQNDPVAKETGLVSSFAPNTFTYQGHSFSRIQDISSAGATNMMLYAMKTDDSNAENELWNGIGASKVWVTFVNTLIDTFVGLLTTALIGLAGIATGGAGLFLLGPLIGTIVGAAAGALKTAVGNAITNSSFSLGDNRDVLVQNIEMDAALGFVSGLRGFKVVAEGAAKAGGGGGGVIKQVVKTNSQLTRGGGFRVAKVATRGEGALVSTEIKAIAGTVAAEEIQQVVSTTVKNVVTRGVPKTVGGTITKNGLNPLKGTWTFGTNNITTGTATVFNTPKQIIKPCVTATEQVTTYTVKKSIATNYINAVLASSNNTAAKNFTSEVSSTTVKRLIQKTTGKVALPVNKGATSLPLGALVAQTLSLDQLSSLHQVLYGLVTGKLSSVDDYVSTLNIIKPNQSYLNNSTDVTLSQLASYSALTHAPYIGALNGSGKNSIISQSLMEATYNASIASIPPYTPATRPAYTPKYPIAANSLPYGETYGNPANIGYYLTQGTLWTPDNTSTTMSGDACNVVAYANPLHMNKNYLWNGGGHVYVGSGQSSPGFAEVNLYKGLTRASYTSAGICVMSGYEDSDLNYQSELYLGNRKVPYNKGKREMPNNVFSGATNLNIVIGPAITSIPSYAFCSTNGSDGQLPFTIRNVYIGPNVTSIGAQAFYRSNVDYVYYPSSCTTLASQCFANCGLIGAVAYNNATTTTYNAPGTVTVMLNSNTKITYVDGGVAFSNFKTATIGTTQISGNNGSNILTVTPNTSSTQAIWFPVTQVTQNRYPIGSFTNYSQSGSNLTYTYQTPAAGSFTVQIGGSSSYQITNALVAVAGSGSGIVASLRAMVAPTPSFIADDAFADCSGLTEFTFPDNFSGFGANAFKNCISLQNLNIPEGTTTIGDGALAGCTGLQQVTLPSSLTDVSDNAFPQDASGMNVVIPAISAALASIIPQLPPTATIFAATSEVAASVSSSLPAGSTLTVVIDTPPSPPTNVSATAGDETITISWTAPTVTTQSVIASYALDISGDGGDFVMSNITSTTFTLRGLSNRVPYSITVSAVNTNGLISDPSSPVTATPVPPALAESDFTNLFATSDTSGGLKPEFFTFYFDLSENESTVNVWAQSDGDAATDDTLIRLYTQPENVNLLDASHCTVISGATLHDDIGAIIFDNSLNNVSEIPTLVWSSLSADTRYYVTAATYGSVTNLSLILQTYSGRSIPITLSKSGTAVNPYTGLISSEDGSLQTFTIDGVSMLDSSGNLTVDGIQVRNATSVSVVAVATDSEAIVDICGGTNLVEGAQDLIVSVTAADSVTVYTYSVTLNVFLNTISEQTVNNVVALLENPDDLGAISTAAASVIDDLSNNVAGQSLVASEFLAPLASLTLDTNVNLIVSAAVQLSSANNDVKALFNEALESSGVQPNVPYDICFNVVESIIVSIPASFINPDYYPQSLAITLPDSSAGSIVVDFNSPENMLALLPGLPYTMSAIYSGMSSIDSYSVTYSRTDEARSLVVDGTSYNLNDKINFSFSDGTSMYMELKAFASPTGTTGMNPTTTTTTTQDPNTPTTTTTTTQAPTTSPICFLGNAPILTPSGYKRMDSLRKGDLVTTSDGRAVAIQSVEIRATAPHSNSNPYIIPTGLYGATMNLPISPRHRVAVPGRGMVEARDLGLKQMPMRATWNYYNLSLPCWNTDNLVVAGVVAESLAPVKRITVTKAEFVKMLAKLYISEGGKETQVRRCLSQSKVNADGSVDVTVLRKNKH